MKPEETTAEQQNDAQAERYLLVEYETMGTVVPDENYPEYNAGHDNVERGFWLMTESEYYENQPDQETYRSTKVVAEFRASDPMVKAINMHEKLKDALRMICNYASQNKFDINVLRQMAGQGSELLEQAEQK